MKLKLKFNSDAKVNGEVVYKAGNIYDIPVANGQADRWIKRGAEEVKEAPVKEAPVKESPVKEAPVKEAPVKEAPVKEAPVKEAPVDNTESKKENKKEKKVKNS